MELHCGSTRPLSSVSYLIFIPLSDGLATGLIITGTAAGAPFLPKLVQLAKGNTAFSVGLMTLLMVVTVIYLPIVLPILLPGASVSPWGHRQILDPDDVVAPGYRPLHQSSL